MLIKALAVLLSLLLAVLVSSFALKVTALRVTNRVRGWLLMVQLFFWTGFLVNCAFMLSEVLDRKKFLFLILLLLMVATAGFTFLRNILAGISIAWEDRLKLGDYISIGASSGHIKAFGLRSIRLQREDATVLEIPNYSFISQPFSNYHANSGAAICELTVTLPDSVELDEATQRLLSIAQLNPYASPRHRADVFLLDSAPDEPRRMKVRGYVFDPSFSARYSSEVLARARRELSGSDLIHSKFGNRMV